MKKITALLGSKRKKNTYKLLMEIKEVLLKNNMELEIIELYKYDIKDCIGCYHCVLKGGCVLKDDTCEIMDKLISSDGIILASPVYLQQVSGKLKTFFDRTCSWYHRPPLTGKPLLSVSTTKGSGLKITLKYLENITVQWGAILGGTVGRTIFNQKNIVSLKELSKFLMLINNPEKYAPSFNELMSFEVQKSLSQHLNELDKAYWENMNWMDKLYFYRCKVNPFKRAITGIARSLLRNRFSKSNRVEE